MRYKIGAIIHEVHKGSEKWYIKAGWKKLEEKKVDTEVSTKPKRKDKKVPRK